MSWKFEVLFLCLVISLKSILYKLESKQPLWELFIPWVCSMYARNTYIWINCHLFFLLICFFPTMVCFNQEFRKAEDKNNFLSYKPFCLAALSGVNQFWLLLQTYHSLGGSKNRYIPHSSRGQKSMTRAAGPGSGEGLFLACRLSCPHVAASGRSAYFISL